MKGCIIGGAVLAMVMTLVILNAVFVNHTVEELTEELDALPEIPDSESTPAKVIVLREVLESKEALLGLSVSYEVTDRATEALRSLEASARSGDVYQYQATLEILRDLIEDIGRLEKLSVRNLL